MFLYWNISVPRTYRQCFNIDKPSFYNGFETINSYINPDDSIFLSIFDSCLTIPNFITFSTIDDDRTLGFSILNRRDPETISFACNLDGVYKSKELLV